MVVAYVNNMRGGACCSLHPLYTPSTHPLHTLYTPWRKGEMRVSLLVQAEDVALELVEADLTTLVGVHHAK